MFAAQSHRQSLTPSISPTRSVGGVDDIAAGLAEELDHVDRYFDIIIVRKMKQSLCDDTIYALEDDKLLQFTVIRSLVRAHGAGLPFVFYKLYYDIMAIINI